MWPTFALCLSCATTMSLSPNPLLAPVSLAKVVKEKEISLELVREHKGAAYHRISPDGSKVLLYETDQPLRRFVLKPNRPARQVTGGGGRLVVVHITNGEIVGTLPISDWPISAEFFPDSSAVVLVPPQRGARELILWTPGGQTVTTAQVDTTAGRVGSVVPLNDHIAVAISEGPDQHPCVVHLDLRSGAVTRRVPIDPSDSGAFLRESMNMSPGRSYLATVTSSRSIIVRRTSDLSLVWKQPWPRNLAPGGLGFSGQFLVGTGHFGNGFPGDPGSVDCILIYKADGGELLRRIERPAGRATMSSDGSLLLSSEQERGKGFLVRTRGVAVICDPESGRELTRVAHPWKTGDHARIWHAGAYGDFTPDMKYLVTGSNQETRVWRVVRGTALLPGQAVPF